MGNELALNFMKVIQDYFKEQKNHVKLYFRGEEAILLFLFEKLKEKTITPSDISEKLEISTARVAVSLNSLQTKKLITRNIDLFDRRKINIRLTKLGQEQATHLKTTHLNKLNNILMKLGQKDTQELLRIIRKFIKIMKEEKNYA